MKNILIIAITTMGTACSPQMHRGSFSMVSTESLERKSELLSETRVEGKACFNFLKAGLFMGDGVFEAATKDALSQIKGATALVDAQFEDDGSCIIVNGLPARLLLPIRQ